MSDDKRVVDLSRHHFLRAVGDLVIVGTWWWCKDQEAWEPCLVVTHRYRKTGFRPVLIALSAAYKYDDPVYMAHAVKQFIELLQLQGNATVAYDIATMINDHLSDLISMPPNPTTSIIVADGSIGSGSSKKTFEIVDYINTPQA